MTSGEPSGQGWTQDVVRGLTTAAVVWMSVAYRDGEGALRTILELVTRSDYVVEHAATNRVEPDEDDHGRGLIDLRLRLRGPRQVNDLLTALAEQPGVMSVETGDVDDTTE